MIRSFFYLLIMLTFAACANGQEFKNVNSSEFKILIEKNDGILLDVRTEREFANGHIPESKQLNFYNPNFRNQILGLPKDKPLYIYCNTGYRSRLTANFLAYNGYDKVYNLQRGIMEWNQHQFPLVRTADAQTQQENMMRKDEFEALLKANQLVLIDFYAPWCAPCRKMMPMIDSLAVEMTGRVSIVKVNTDASQDLIRELQVRRIPYFVLYKNGQPVFTHEGMITREALLETFRQHGGIK